MTERPQPDIREIRLVGIPVTDQDRALRFYTETLGFELQMDVPLPQQGSRWIVVADPEGNEFCVCDGGQPNPTS